MKKKKFNCPAEMTVSLIGGRWKVILVYNLRKGVKRFGELKGSRPELLLLLSRCNFMNLKRVES